MVFFAFCWVWQEGAEVRMEGCGSGYGLRSVVLGAGCVVKRDGVGSSSRCVVA